MPVSVPYFNELASDIKKLPQGRWHAFSLPQNVFIN
jgi:hypothetical protein